jgi:hypothetical protein
MSKTITISDETWDKVREQVMEEETPIELTCFDDLIGKAIFIRTVTYHYLGKYTKRVGNFLQLEQASWVADSGRFADFLKKGLQSGSEIEPMGTTLVNTEVIIDVTPWTHELPKETT